jgi:tetratricopeptide (TPR) repeat protein
MSVYLERARLLLAQARPAEAEREAMQVLAQDPADAEALAILAMSRSAQRRFPDALEAAKAAIAQQPDQPYFHYVHAHVLHHSERDDEAANAIDEALRLDPTNPDLLTMRSSIELSRRRWPAALEAAEQALAAQPEHVDAANLRAMALVRLGRKAEAMETVEYALHRDPENALSHANQGWNCLHRNDPRAAQEHFREALRLSPNLEYAREGMLQALNARSPIYRGMLAYFLWMSRLSGRLQGAFLVGIWLGGRVLRTLAENMPSVAWLWWSLLVVLYLFIYLSWTAQPMFNLALRFNRFGRHVLSDDQRVASNWFAVPLAGALVSFAWWVFARETLPLLLIIGFLGLSIAVAATFARRGRPRRVLAIATGAMAVVGVAAIAALFYGQVEVAAILGTIYLMSFLAIQLFANFAMR